MAMIGENQVRNFFVVETSGDYNISEIAGAGKLNGAIVTSNGDNAAPGPFMLSYKNSKGVLINSDVIVPENVTYAKSIAFAPKVEQFFKIGEITADANTLYEIRVIFVGYGSLSIEDELTLEGFYKSKANDTAEDIIDGLIKNLSKNASKMQQEASSFFNYDLANGDTISLPDNNTLEFIKSYSDGTAEETTITVDAVATSSGTATITLNDEEFTLEVTPEATVEEQAEELSFALSEINGYTVSVAGDTITIVSDTAEDESDASFSTGSIDDLAVTVVTTENGVDGTSANAEIIIKEKSSWLSNYYVTGKKDRLWCNFTVQANFTTEPTIVKNVGDSGHGTGYHVRNMEYYFKGNRADTFRGAGYPVNFEEIYDSVLTDEYSIIELAYFDEGRDDPMKSKKQLTIAIPNLTEANTVIGAINTALTNVGYSLDILS
jgi:hypothetical protein